MIPVCSPAGSVLFLSLSVWNNFSSTVKYALNPRVNIFFFVKSRLQRPDSRFIVSIMDVSVSC